MKNFDQQIFRARRQRFIEQIAGGVAILPSAPVAVRSNDVEFVYRQSSDYYYLSGFHEPESVAVFAPGRKDGEFVLFVRPRDKERETWNGRRAGIEGAMTEFGADQAFTIDQLPTVLPRFLENVGKVYYGWLETHEPLNSQIFEVLKHSQAMRPRTGLGPNALLDPREILNEMRLYKSPEELDAMRTAIKISGQAHQRAMRETRPGMHEWQVEALIDYTFRSNGAAGPAYPSIVASGPNATILHYIENDREIRAGELLLLDAGCEYNYYASDITRTYPVASRFSPVQRELYEIVLAAQLTAIDTVKPGVRFDDVHNAALRVLVEGMRSLKLLEGTTDEIISAASYRRFYMHGTSHWLGMDVHDVGHYRREGLSRELKPGMVLTVEPGIYIGADDESAPQHLRGIGIRIEDDVLVTEGGHEVLSAAIPKKLEDVEALTAG